MADKTPVIDIETKKQAIISAIESKRFVRVCYTCPQNYEEGRKQDISYLAGFDSATGQPIFVAMPPLIHPYENALLAPQCPSCQSIDEIDIAMAKRNLEKILNTSMP